MLMYDVIVLDLVKLVKHLQQYRPRKKSRSERANLCTVLVSISLVFH